MKKHKTIGVAILVVAFFSAIGFAWYSKNAYVGLNDVKAADISQYDKDGQCENSAEVDLNITSDKITIKTSAQREFTVRYYVLPNASYPGPDASIDDQYQVKEEKITGPNTVVSDIAPSQNPGKSTVVEVTWEGDKQGCFVRSVKEQPDTSVLTNYYSNVCQQWKNGDVISFEYDSNGDGKISKSEKYTLNSKFSEYSGTAGKSEEFLKYKNENAATMCDPNYAFNGTKEQFEYMLYYMESVFDNWYKAESAAKSGNSNSSNNNNNNGTSNGGGGIVTGGDPTESGTITSGGTNPNDEDYEEVEDTNISTLYCKVNSVYLKDVDEENALEKEDSNQFALNYQGNPSFKEATESNALESSGEAKPNLYLLKHTEVTKEPYTVYVNGESDGQEHYACATSCTEYLKVNFDPPQEVTAGTCFSYAVQVISYTECKVITADSPNPADDSGNPDDNSDSNTNPDTNPALNLDPLPQPPVSATAVPDCDHLATHKHADRGGPDEDFDACINKCDGGKYTDKCSVKCLNEVYGTDKSESKEKTPTGVSFNSGSSVVLGKFMANESGSDQCPSWDAPKETIKQFFATHASGTYYSDNGKVRFKTNYPGCYWAQYAPYYLTGSVFEETYANDVHNGGTYAPSTLVDSKHNDANYTESHGGAGFRLWANCDGNRNQEFPGCYVWCSVKCNYTGVGGAGSNFGIKLPDGTIANGIGDNVGQSAEDYRKTVESYNNALAKCTADAKCRSTSETKSTFYIGVNDEEDKWSATNDTGGTSEPQHSGEGCVKSSGDLIIQGRDSTNDTITDGTGGLCYCGNEDYGDWHHYTRWTFPGRWVDKKSNKVTNEPPEKGAEGFYDGGYNKYCIDRDEKEDVNVDWLKQLLDNKDQYGSEKDARAHMSEQNISDWNISARTEHFGNYDWSISTKCFYSLTTKTVSRNYSENNDNNNPSTPAPTNPNKNTDNNAEAQSISSTNVRIKAADPENPIPAKGGDGKAESWNWSDAATKLDIESDDGFVYEITPGAYREYVEDLGDNVFTDDYLDYEFKFTGQELRDIAREGETFGDYSSGDAVAIVGTDENKANSLYAYKSTFLRGLGKSVLKMPKSDKALRCNNLDSKGSGGATGCSDTSNGINPTTAVTEFKSKMKK